MIRDGQVVTPGGVVTGGVAVDGERLVAVGADATLPAARRTIEARGQYVLPGLIDAHVHMGSEEDPSIAEGADADVIIVDPEREALVDDWFYHCLCETSVYAGSRFRGMVCPTVVRGRVMMHEYETVGAPGWGRYVPRGPAAGGRS